MKKNESMKKIEQLLEMAPEVNDTRTKEEVFARLKKEGVFEEKLDKKEKEIRTNYREEIPKRKQRNGSIITTFIVAATAMLTFGGVGGYLISQSNQSAVDEAASGTNISTMDDNANIESAVNYEIDSSNEEQANVINGEMTSYIPESSLIWEGDFEGTLQLGLVTEQLDVVPVTFLIDESRISQDFVSDTATYLNHYIRYASDVDEEALGFIAYHPLEGELQEENDLITHVLPEGHPYDAGSAAEILYEQVLNATFSSEYTKVQTLDKNGRPIEFSHMGQLEQITLEGHWQNSYFVIEKGGVSYLVPVKHIENNDVESALLNLQQEPQNPDFKSPILDGVNYSVTLSGDTVTIAFTEPLQLDKYEATQRALMFDAMIMTAASYGISIQFENVVDTEGNTYPLGEPIKRPISMNKIVLDMN